MSQSNGNPLYDELAERATAGACMLSPEALASVVATVSTDDFRDPQTHIIMRTIADLHRAGQPVDMTTVGIRLGPDYLTALTLCVEAVGLTRNVDWYASTVRDRAERRRIVEECKQRTAAALDINRPLEGRANDAYAPITIGELIAQHPYLDPYVIDGLIRIKETANIIAPSKVGKSWLLYLILLCIVTGRDLFGRHRCRPGKVALIDNELNRAVLAHRIKTVADALQIHPADYHDKIVPYCLRGKLLDLAGIGRHIIPKIPQGEYQAIAIDAWYRVIGDAETNNPEMARAYNTIDQFAEQTGAAWLLVHHSTKGDQSAKRVVDVGAGSNSQSRAADSHIILREHEEDGVIVMESAVRSFSPNQPIPLRWTFPLWQSDDFVDPAALKGRKTSKEEKQSTEDNAGIQDIIAALADGKMTESVIRKSVGMGSERASRLLGVLYKEKKVSRKNVKVRGNDCFEYELL